MSFRIFVRLLFVFLIFFLLRGRVCCEIFGGGQSCTALLQGLADRGLFDSAEILYLTESKKPELNRKDKYILASSIVYSRTLQILTLTGSARSKLYGQLADFESEFQNSIKKLRSEQPPTNSFSGEKLELIRLQVRFAVARYLIGGRMRFEAEVAEGNNAAQLNNNAQKILLTATEQLKKINSYLAAQQNPVFAEQINFLSDKINLYIYLSEISYLLSIPADNIRNDKLNRLIVSFDDWSKNKLEFYSNKLKLYESKLPEFILDSYYLLIRARVEVSACYRLLGELGKSFNVLSVRELGLGKVELSSDLRLRIAAERLRFLAASANNVTINSRIAEAADKGVWNANELLRLRVSLSPDSFEYCLARLEWGLFLAARMKVSDAGTELMIIRDVLKLVRQMEAKIPSCGYCAAVVIGTNKNAENNINNSRLSAIKAAILGELAQDKRERNQIEEAVKLFELAGRILESAGDKDAAMKNAQYSISLLYDLLKQFENSKELAARNSTGGEDVDRGFDEAIFGCRERIMKSLCGVSCRLSGNRESVELYRRGIDEATILFKAKRLNVDEYIAVLSGYVSCWGEESDCGVYRLRAANLLEFNGRFDDALVFLGKIPNGSLQALDAVASADRCFRQIQIRNKNKNNADNNSNNSNGNKSGNGSEDESGINVTKNEFDWFKRRLRAEVLEWTEADAATVIKMAERIFYQRGFPLFYWELVDGDLLRELESNLKMAIDRCKPVKFVTIARLKIMLVIANNLRGDHVKSAELLKQVSGGQVGLLTEMERMFLRRLGVEVLVMSGDVVGGMLELSVMLNAESRNLMLLELKAEILSRQDDKAMLTEAVKTWGLIGTIAKEKSDQWWNAREKIINIYIKQGNHNEAKKIYKRLKFLHPNLGNKTRKERLEKLINKE
ncbi:MAG: hypothetical protein LBT09_07970 [Planctomycetaceae bacterium]|jgi:hypothetical protein|nr:hypothetical protein [Planctomycetaceae bacterium]